jgi:nicotinamide-nucleotide amidase
MRPVQLAEAVVAYLRAKGMTITTVESCTGGMIASAITSVAGASDVFEAGFVTYANEAKTALVGVPKLLLQTHGAVSEPVAAAMAEGGLKAAKADMSISITGIAGPSGGSDEKPIGMVCFGLSQRKSDTELFTQTQTYFFGDIGRDEVRNQSLDQALSWIVQVLLKT